MKKNDATQQKERLTKQAQRYSAHQLVNQYTDVVRRQENSATPDDVDTMKFRILRAELVRRLKETD